MARDPCDSALGAYRLSGPLAPAVCGLRLDRGYLLAFTMQSALTDEDRPQVVLLSVGKREPGHRVVRTSDIWDDLHDLFGVGNPPADHHKPPCCDGGRPDLGGADLDAFFRALRRFNRGR